MTTVSSAIGKERGIPKTRRNHVLIFPVQPRHREGRIEIAPDACEDFTMRKELDAFFKATERWHLTPRRAARVARCVVGGTVVALPP